MFRRSRLAAACTALMFLCDIAMAYDPSSNICKSTDSRHQAGTSGDSHKLDIVTKHRAPLMILLGVVVIWVSSSST